jgi:hypothetical protein
LRHGLDPVQVALSVFATVIGMLMQVLFCLAPFILTAPRPNLRGSVSGDFGSKVYCRQIRRSALSGREGEPWLAFPSSLSSPFCTTSPVMVFFRQQFAGLALQRLAP